MFRVLYIIFLVSITWYANTRVLGALSIRHVMTLVMFFACITNVRITSWTNRYLNKYFAFLLFFGLSSIVTGFTDSYLIFVIRNVPTLTVAYWATRILKDKYNSVSIMVYTLLAMGLLNSLVIIGQFFYIPFFRQLPETLHISIDADFLINQELERDLLGLTIPGLMINTVTNGYFTMVVAILYAYVSKQKINVLVIIPWLITMAASYFVQERGPFYIALAFSVYLLFIKIKVTTSTLKKFLYFCVFTVVIIYGISKLYPFLLEGGSRFALGTDAVNRDVLFHKSFEFISENLLFGGFYKLLDSGVTAHNLILNALIYGGIFGALFIFSLLYQQFKEIVKIYTRGISIDNYQNLVIGSVFIAYTLNSFIHNLSIVTGDALIWVIWGAFFINNKSQINQTK